MEASRTWREVFKGGPWGPEMQKKFSPEVEQLNGTGTRGTRGDAGGHGEEDTTQTHTGAGGRTGGKWEREGGGEVKKGAWRVLGGAR